jgi:hypothetical protein
MLSVGGARRASSCGHLRASPAAAATAAGPILHVIDDPCATRYLYRHVNPWHASSAQHVRCVSS